MSSVFLQNYKQFKSELYFELQDLQLGDIFNWPDAGAGVPSPACSPRRDSTSQPGSPGTSGRQSPFQSGGQGRVSGFFFCKIANSQSYPVYLVGFN